MLDDTLCRYIFSIVEMMQSLCKIDALNVFYKRASNDFNRVKRFYCCSFFHIRWKTSRYFMNYFVCVFFSHKINHTWKINGYLLKSVASCKMKRNRAREEKRRRQRLLKIWLPFLVVVVNRLFACLFVCLYLCLHVNSICKYNFSSVINFQRKIHQAINQIKSHLSLSLPHTHSRAF